MRRYHSFFQVQNAVHADEPHDYLEMSPKFWYLFWKLVLFPPVTNLLNEKNSQMEL